MFPAFKGVGAAASTIELSRFALYSVKPKDPLAWQYATPHIRMRVGQDSSGVDVYRDFEFPWNPNRQCWEGLVFYIEDMDLTDSASTWYNKPSRFLYRGFTNNVIYQQLDADVNSSTFGKPKSGALIRPAIEVVRNNPTCKALSATQSYAGGQVELAVGKSTTTANLSVDVTAFTALSPTDQMYTLLTLWVSTAELGTALASMHYLQFHTGKIADNVCLDKVIDTK